MAFGVFLFDDAFGFDLGIGRFHPDSSIRRHHIALFPHSLYYLLQRKGKFLDFEHDSL